MTSNARELAQIPSTPSGRRNLLINGAMQVAQRSTSATNVSTAGYHACDRWNLIMNGRDEAVFTVSQHSSSIVDGFSNSFKVQTTTAESAIASDEYFIVRQLIEGENLQHLAYATSSAKTTTLSFYVKSSVAATFAVYIYKPNSTARIIGGTYTINSADTWEYKTITFAGDTDSGATINGGNGAGFHIAFPLAVGSDWITTDNTSWADYANGKLAFGHAGNAVVTTTNATWEITGVQFEVGSVATEFEYRSFAEEFQLCERYFQYVRPAYYDGQTTNKYLGLTLSVPLRATASATRLGNVISGAESTTTMTFTSPTTYYLNNNAVGVGGVYNMDAEL